ncbi:MAG: TatD family hydrolase [Candidatus Saccharibacteria bacterium]
MIELTDTHCHIQSIGALNGEKVTIGLWSKLEGATIDGVVSSAKEDGVNRLIAVGCTLEDSKLAINVASNHPGVWSSIGIHPHEAKNYVANKSKLEDFASLASKEKVVAVGECGLDYYYGHSEPEDQRKILEFQLELAQRHNLPVIFHVREAFDDFWPIFEKYKGIKGVLHSFTDSMDNLNKALEHGLLIGVNGIATFAKNPNQTEVYKAIPLENLLLETDSPFLTPSPFRGKINEPKNVRLVAEYLANLSSQSVETLSRQTTVNAIELFNI